MSGQTAYWLSCGICTIEVEADAAGIVRTAAPIARKFIGRPLADLQRWMKKYGGYQCVVLAKQTDLFGEDDAGTVGPTAA